MDIPHLPLALAGRSGGRLWLHDTTDRQRSSPPAAKTRMFRRRARAWHRRRPRATIALDPPRPAGPASW